MYTSPSSRRAFLQATAAGFAGLIGCRGSDPVSPTLEAATVRTRPSPPTITPEVGLTTFGKIANGGFLYVPPTYRADVPAPLIVLLHGAGRRSNEWSDGPLGAVADDLGIVLAGYNSDGVTWDLLDRGGFGPDVRSLDEILSYVFARCRIDASRLALGGFSDGASYALSLGLANGDFFTHLLAFSPGLIQAPGTRGKPRIHITHGRSDGILPFENTESILVPRLIEAGYDVTFAPFDGPHTVTIPVCRGAFEWLATS